MTQIEQLVATLEQQDATKKDYFAAPANMFLENGNLVLMADKKEVSYQPTDIFHSQVSEYLNIPKVYYDRMRSSNLELLDENVNAWLKQTEKKKLVRTFESSEGGNIARAFLSDRFNIIDNYEILFEALAAIRETGVNVEIEAAELSETRMYITVICPDVEVRAKEFLKKYIKSMSLGDGIVSGFKIFNSEVGRGAYGIVPRAQVVCCHNGLIMEKEALKRVHLGGKMDELDFEKNRNVRNANLRLIKEQLKHAVKVFLSKPYLEKIVNNFTALGEKEIEAPIANVIEVVQKEFSLTDERKANILNFFIKAGDTRRAGLVHAITEECQTLSDIDAKHDAEGMAYDVLTSFDKIEAKAFKTKFTAN